MPSPTYSWNDITTSQTDADSPVDTALMEGIRQNLVHLQEWLGYGYAAAQAHTHNGTDSAYITALGSNSVGTASILDANVTLSKLKMAQGSYSIAGPWSGDIYVAIGNDYAHLPTITGTNTTNPINFSVGFSGMMPSGQYFNLNGAAVDGTVTVSWYYHSN